MSDYNFGELLVDSKTGNVTISIRNIENQIFFRHEIDLNSDELRFNETKLQLNRELCINVQRDQKILGKVISLLRNFLFYPHDNVVFSLQSMRMYLGYLFPWMFAAFWINVAYKLILNIGKFFWNLVPLK